MVQWLTWESKKGCDMMRTQSGITIFGIICTVIILTACAGEPLKVEPIAKSENPSTMMDKLGQGLAAARQNRADLFSPTWFAAAQMFSLSADF